MIRVRNVTGIAILLVIGLLGLVACGGGGGGGSSSSCTECENAAGTWDTQEHIQSAACGEDSWDYNTYAVTQSGCSLTVVPVGSGLSFKGSICGSTLSWSGSYPEGVGTTKITSMTMTLAGTTTFSGTAHWSWSGPGYPSCSGTTQVTATKE
jgi:hypothetical protein